MSVNEVKRKHATEAFVVRGTGPPTSRTFCIGDEDHTLGNALRHVLMQDPRVSFCGYSVPHPSEPVVQIRVQTHVTSSSNSSSSSSRTGGITAARALHDGCQTLSDQCAIILDKLEQLLPVVQDDRLKMEQLFYEEGDEQEGDDVGGEHNNDGNEPTEMIE